MILRVPSRVTAAFALLLTAAFAAAPPVCAAADLALRICGLESRRGDLRIAVFSRDHAGEFMDAASEAYAAGLVVHLADHAAERDVEVRVPGLAPGEYAVRIFHDENANGIFDRGALVGLPKELYGYSRNARARFSAVGFDEAAITVGEQPMQIDVRMVHWSVRGGDTSPCGATGTADSGPP